MSESPPEPTISTWLESIGMGEYAPAFIENHVTLDVLGMVTDADLKECGVSALGHRKLILAAIQGQRLETGPLPVSQQTGPIPTGTGQLTKLGHFELLEKLGSGGMGAVYRGWDTSLNRQVAIKVLDRDLAKSDPQFFSDFVREAQNAAGINHAHIVQIYFVGEDAGDYYIAMELLEGQTLDDRLLRGPMDEVSVLDVAKQAVEALSATNARRLIHGDIKPQNIFLTKDGDVKLLDFGLARKRNTSGLTEGGIFGSPYFVSPERACGQVEDFRSDIYSLGATLFYAISGMYPFEADDTAVLVRKRLEEEAPRLRSVKPNASVTLEVLLAKMMARDPAKRHKNYEALLAEITTTERAVRSGYDSGKKMTLRIPGEALSIYGVPSMVAGPVMQPRPRAFRPSARPVMVPAEGIAPARLDEASLQPVRKPSLFNRIRNNRFLFISIIAHVLFVLVATIFVVQTITSRKLTFTSASTSPNPSERSLEHEVSMAKKHNSMGAPVQARRIATTGISKITLPDMPAISTSTDFTPGKMAGMGGFGEGMGLGMGGGGGGGGSGGGGITMFGLRSAGIGLPGHFYDLKQSENRDPAGTTSQSYTSIVQEFVRNGWHETDFSNKYYRASITLYAAQIFTPEFPAELAPEAYGVQNEVQPKLWVALYTGFVSPPESGVYHFVGAGDDVMMVRFEGRNVLDRCFEMQEQRVKPVVQATANYKYDGWKPPGDKWPTIPNGFARGPAISVEAGRYYPIKILIGEQPGGYSGFALLIEKDGVEYQKDSHGDPILPIFRVANQPLMTPLPGSSQYAPHMEGGPIWQSKPPSSADSDVDTDNDSISQ